MSHNQKIVVFVGIVAGTAIFLWGKRAIPSLFTFWPEK